MTRLRIFLELNGIYIYIYIFYKRTTIKILFIHFEEVKLQTNCVINVIFNIRFLLMESAEKV